MKNKKLNRWRQLAVCAAIFLSAPFLMAQSPVGSEFLVNPESPGLQHEPDLQFDSDGALWFTWLDSMGPEAEFNRVEARAVSSHGELGPVLDLVTTSGVPITPALYPLVVPTQGGGVHLFYTRQTEDGIAHVYGQQFDTAGHALGDRTILTPPSPVSAIGLAVAPLPEGGFSLMTSGFLCFTCPGPTRGSIFARLLAADGSPASTYFRAPRKSETASSGVRGMAVDGPGNITFVWSPLTGILTLVITRTSTAGASPRPASRSARSSWSTPLFAVPSSVPRWRRMKMAISWSSGRRVFRRVAPLDLRPAVLEDGPEGRPGVPGQRGAIREGLRPLGGDGSRGRLRGGVAEFLRPPTGARCAPGAGALYRRDGDARGSRVPRGSGVCRLRRRARRSPSVPTASLPVGPSIEGQPRDRDRLRRPSRALLGVSSPALVDDPQIHVRRRRLDGRVVVLHQGHLRRRWRSP